MRGGERGPGRLRVMHDVQFARHGETRKSWDSGDPGRHARIYDCGPRAGWRIGTSRSRRGLRRASDSGSNAAGNRGESGSRHWRDHRQTHGWRRERRRAGAFVSGKQVKPRSLPLAVLNRTFMDYQKLTLTQIFDEAEAIAGDAKTLFSHLTPQQLNWKPAADSWSVAQCLDH